MVFGAALLTAALAALAKTINTFSFFVARAVYALVRQLDPDNAFLVLTIHHIVQAVIALALIGAYARWRSLRLADFGFRVEGLRASLRPLLVFTGIWTILQAVLTYVYIYVQEKPYYLTFRFGLINAVGYFLFEVLLSGTSEEILFRALILTMLLRFFAGRTPSAAMGEALAIFLSTLIFMFDHIVFGWNPLRIVYINPAQQATCLIFGLLYGILFIRYKTVYSAMLAHNVLNGAITALSLFFFLSYPLWSIK